MTSTIPSSPDDISFQAIIDKMNACLAEFWALTQHAKGHALHVDGAVWTNTGNPMLLIRGGKQPVVEKINPDAA